MVLDPCADVDETHFSSTPTSLCLMTGTALSKSSGKKRLKVAVTCQGQQKEKHGQTSHNTASTCARGSICTEHKGRFLCVNFRHPTHPASEVGGMVEMGYISLDAKSGIPLTTL